MSSSGQGRRYQHNKGNVSLPEKGWGQVCEHCSCKTGSFLSSGSSAVHKSTVFPAFPWGTSISQRVHVNMEPECLLCFTSEAGMPCPLPG